MKQFFVLRRPRRGTDDSEMDFYDIDDNVGDAPTCPECGRFIGMLEWLPPYTGELELWGRQFADVVIVPGGLIVSQRFKDTYEDHNLSGLKNFCPVRIVRAVFRKKTVTEEIPHYYYTTVTQSTVPVDDEASEIIRNRPRTCSWCFSGDTECATRIVLNLASYQGEDIFIARGLPGIEIVSDRFRDTCQRNHIRHAHFISCDQFHFKYGS